MIILLHFILFFDDRGGINKFGVLMGGGSPNYVVVGSNAVILMAVYMVSGTIFVLHVSGTGRSSALYINGVFDGASGTSYE